MTADRGESGRRDRWTRERLGALADAVRASPEIVRLHAGAAGEVAAHLPGARVPGIRLVGDDRIEVHVVMSLHSSVDLVEAAILDAAGDDRSRVDVVVEDIADPSAAEMDGGPSVELVDRSDDAVSDDSLRSG